MSLDRIVQDAASEGTFHSEGEFSIDWRAADRKIAEFFRAHPGLWILKFIQAAVAVHSRFIDIKLTSGNLLIGFETMGNVPSPPELEAEGEFQEHLTIGIRALFAGAENVDSLTLVWHLEGDREDDPSIVSLRLNPDRTRKLERLSLEEYARLETLSGLEGSLRTQMLVIVRWASGSWWSNLRSRIGRNAAMHLHISRRLTFCPVPVRFSGALYGQGCGKPYNARAAEYILGPLWEDTIVRETEPGFGSDVFEVFGEREADLGEQFRKFTRWCQVKDEPLFPYHGLCVVEPLRSFNPPPDHVGSCGPTFKHKLPNGAIPIFGGKVYGGIFSLVDLKSYVVLHPEYRAPASSNGRDTPGFPIYASITIHSSRRGPGRVSFFRRGVLVCQTDLDLGEGVDALVCCAALKTDYSGMAVVQDKTYDRLIALLRERARKLREDLDELTTQSPSSSSSSRYRSP